MTEVTDTVFAPIAANPYSFPFDGKWSSSDTALLLLGFQRGAIDALDAHSELQVAIDLLEAAAARGVTVVAVRRGYGPEESPMAARRRRLGDPIPARGSPEWQLDQRIVLPPDAIVVEAPGDNAFFATGLEATLRRSSVRNLVIAGLPTEGLVHASQRAANDMGFECVAVADACKGTSEPRHSAQLRITTFGNGLFGTVAYAAEIHSVFSKH